MLKQLYKVTIKGGPIEGATFLGSIKQGDQYVNVLQATITDAEGNVISSSNDYAIFFHGKRCDGKSSYIAMRPLEANNSWFCLIPAWFTDKPGKLECNIEIRSLKEANSGEESITVYDSINGEEQVLEDVFYRSFSDMFSFNVERTSKADKLAIDDPDEFAEFETTVYQELNKTSEEVFELKKEVEEKQNQIVGQDELIESKYLPHYLVVAITNNVITPSFDTIKKYDSIILDNAVFQKSNAYNDGDTILRFVNVNRESKMINEIIINDDNTFSRNNTMFASVEDLAKYTSLTQFNSTISLINETINNKADLINGKIPASQLPSYVDDVLEFVDKDSFPETGESEKIYIALNTNITYRWGGTEYVEISQSLALGETQQTAYPGNKGKENRERIESLEQNSLSKEDYAAFEIYYDNNRPENPYDGQVICVINTADNSRMYYRYIISGTSGQNVRIEPFGLHHYIDIPIKDLIMDWKDKLGLSNVNRIHFLTTVNVIAMSIEGVISYRENNLLRIYGMVISSEAIYYVKYIEFEYTETTKWSQLMGYILREYSSTLIATQKYVDDTTDEKIEAANQDIDSKLNGKLDKDTSINYMNWKRAYTILPDGTQGTTIMSSTGYPGSIAIFDSDCNLGTPRAPSDNLHYTNKKYVDDENEKLQTELNKLKSQIFEIVLEEATYTFENLGTATIPSGINTLPILESAGCELVKIEGNSEVIDGEIISSKLSKIESYDEQGCFDGAISVCGKTNVSVELTTASSTLIIAMQANTGSFSVAGGANIGKIFAVIEQHKYFLLWNITNITPNAKTEFVLWNRTNNQFIQYPVAIRNGDCYYNVKTFNSNIDINNSVRIQLTGATSLEATPNYAIFIDLTALGIDTLTADEVFNLLTKNGTDFSLVEQLANGGTVEVKKLSTIPLSFDQSVSIVELKGARDAHDRYELQEQEDGTYNLVQITNIGQIDLGGAIWAYTDTSETRKYFLSNNLRALIKPVTTNNDIANILCQKIEYVVTSSNYATSALTDKSYDTAIAINNNMQVVVKDINYIDSSELQQSLNGVMIYYELAEPIETTVATGLTEEQVSLLKIKLGGYLKTDAELVKPNVTFNFVVSKIKEEN